ncbi:PPE family protein [Mycolicibacillus parakoreensis]|uniref:PPE family protein n=1 Tax=Mycolicibacillus parakoreensis TaxID=1069221 RepID=A0ABY3U032_9MYCO|nr:PPE family protein [Mycolicibacillus parakoreensis]MCV7316914.1 PPE family protein [Mycolicibacillus parakoreensis]ULN51265.1 PPE family protein [Mycolicibacillus parakoreensis]
MALFEFLPPEINSFLITAGPGSAPLLAASEAWAALTQELETAATGFGSTVAGLASDWHGPTSTRMQAKLEPYVAWLHDTAAQTSTLAAQATAHAGFFEQARSSMVPLEAVIANRTLCMELISTNILGQNTPAIMVCEALYDIMWADDVMVMSAFDASSKADRPQAMFKTTTNSSDPLTTTALPVDPGGVGEAIGGGLTQLGGALQPLTAFWEPIGTALSGFNEIPVLGAFADLSLTTPGSLSSASELINVPMRLGSAPMSMLMSLTRAGGTSGSGLGQLTGGLTNGATNPLLNAISEMVNGKLQTMTSGLTSQLSNWGSQIGQQVSAQLANASRVGGLSAPEGAIQTITRALPVSPATTVPAVPTVQAGMPGGPFAQAMMGALAGRGFGGLGNAAKAGVKAATAAKGG